MHDCTYTYVHTFSRVQIIQCKKKNRKACQHNKTNKLNATLMHMPRLMVGCYIHFPLQQVLSWCIHTFVRMYMRRLQSKKIVKLTTNFETKIRSSPNQSAVWVSCKQLNFRYGSTAPIARILLFLYQSHAVIKLLVQLFSGKKNLNKFVFLVKMKCL